ncbi:hypothetical protein B0H11DRAFT_1911430 [Mycena galericulata]|nr:hypothetical protein B0H11DRAFT_1911430 [Mycena galericulata]
MSGPIPDMDWLSVVFAREQRGDKTTVAWLFADGPHIHKRLWIKVPLLGKISRASTIDDVDLDLWMDAGRASGEATIDFTDRTFRIDRFPLDEPNDLKHSFTFVISPQHTTGPGVHPINHLINALVPGLDPPWRGNVLVFRHGCTSKKVIVKVEERYWEAVSMMITTSVISSIRHWSAYFVNAWSSVQRNSVIDRSSHKEPTEIINHQQYPNSPRVMTRKIAFVQKHPTTVDDDTASFDRALACAHTPQPQRDTYWALDDIVLYTLRFLSLLHILKFSHLDHRCATLAKLYLRGRIIRYTSPFFTMPRPFFLHRYDLTLLRFYHTLETTHSWIVGSVALAAGSVLSDPPFPDNLNIITKSRELPHWLNFLVHETGFTMLPQVTASGPYERAGHTFVLFQHSKIPNLTVTITTTDDAHLGHLFFASPNSDQHIAVGAYELITPHMRALSNQVHIQGFRPHGRRLESIPLPPPNKLYRTTSRFPGCIVLLDSTRYWSHACGNICPGIQRCAKGLPGFAHIKWGGVDDLDEFTDPALVEIGESRMMYRTGARCANRKCPNRRDKGLYEA